MAIIRLYNHTVNRFVSGENAAGDAYKINLYSALTFDATATTKAAAEAGATQLPTQFGYTQNTKALASVVITAAGSPADDSKFDADDVSWTASGGVIGPAQYALIYNDQDANDPPVAFIDFEAAQTAGDGTPFNINWNASGIITFSYTQPA